MTRLDDQTIVGADGRVETTYPDGSVLTLTVDQPVIRPDRVGMGKGDILCIADQEEV